MRKKVWRSIKFFWQPWKMLYSVWFSVSSSRSILHLLTVASNISGAARTAALNTLKAFYKIWLASLFQKLNCYAISSQFSILIFFKFIRDRQLCRVLCGKSSQEYPYPIKDKTPEGSIPGASFFLLKITDIGIAIYGSRYSRKDQVKFVEDSLKKILLGPFLNTLNYM